MKEQKWVIFSIVIFCAATILFGVYAYNGYAKEQERIARQVSDCVSSGGSHCTKVHLSLFVRVIKDDWIGSGIPKIYR